MRIDTSPESPNHGELREWASRRLGSGCRFEDRSRRVGRRTVTWRITAADGTSFYLKRHEHRHHHAAEVFTLREWVPLLPVADWWSAPSVLLSDDELGAIIMTALPGRTLTHLQLRDSEQAEVHRLAGRLASRLHALDADTDRLERAQLYDPALQRRYLKLAKPHLPSELFRWIETTCSDDDAFEGLATVPTHSDYSPRNWVVEQAGGELRLGLIDWERARASYWLEDIRGMDCREWLKRPALRSAFHDGYGREPTSREQQQLRLIVLLTAAATVPWAIEHGDADFAAFGLATLERLRAEG